MFRPERPACGAIERVAFYCAYEWLSFAHGAEKFASQPQRSYSLDYKKSMSTRPKMSMSLRVTKQMLGNQTRKSILYLDQNFLSSVHRGGIENEWATALMAKVTQRG